MEIWHQREPKPVLSIKGYLLQSIRYKMIRVISDHYKRAAEEVTDEPFTVSAEDLRIQQEKDIERNQQLSAAMESLSPRQREIIYLRFYLGLSYREICAILSMEYQIARNHLSQGLKRLRSLLPSSAMLSWNSSE